MGMHFEGGFRKNYTTSVTRAVGPTTSVGVRGTLPQPAPTDGNSIWLAKNGNDANAGTQGLPKLTLAGAIAALTAGLPTIHIFRNGYVGEMAFTSAANQTLPIGFNLQTEEGEVATLAFTVNFQLILAGTNKLNGVHVSNYVQPIALAITGSLVTLDNVQAGITISAALITTINYCHSSLIFMYSGGITSVNNSILIGSGGTCITVVALATSTITININRSILIGLHPTVDPTQISRIAHILVGNFGSTLTANFNIFSSYLLASTLFTVSPLISIATGLIINNIFDYVAAKAGYNYQNFPILGIPLPVTLTNIITNALSTTVPALFLDYDNGVSNTPVNGHTSAENFQLQRVGKSNLVGSAKYLITSPLAGTGLAGVDVNPWDENTSLTSQTFDTPISILWPATGFKPTVARFVNPIEITDIQGGVHSTYDAVKRSWHLSFGDGSFYANNQDLYRLVQILYDTSTQRWYPRGVGKSIFSQPNGAPIATQGQFAASVGTFTPFISSGIPMIPHHWVGYWIIIVVAGVDQHYYISANDAVQFSLIDKMNFSLPSSGIYYFRIEYILIKIALQDLETVQEYFTNFLHGGSWGEHGTSVINRANTLAHELKGYSIKLLEANEPEEAV